MVEESTEVEIASAVIPVNENRSEYVDFTIICKDQESGEKIKYGVEKAVISSASTFFNDMFKACSNQGNNKKEEFEMMEMSPEAIMKFLQAISGVVDKNSWSIDQSTDVIDLSYKYGADIAVDRGMMKFWRAFLSETCASLLTSRYGKGVAVKYISLWLRVINLDSIGSIEVKQMLFLGFKYAWSRCCALCSTSEDKATISDFIDYESVKYFSGDDIWVAKLFIDHLRNNIDELNLSVFFERLKKEKLERQRKR